jgi:hypothetical protein
MFAPVEMILHNVAGDSSIWMVYVNHVLFYPVECLKDPCWNLRVLGAKT